MKKLVYWLIILVLSICSVYFLDRIMVVRRTDLIVQAVSAYQKNHVDLPDNLQLNLILMNNNNLNNESFCHFYDHKIDGWGNCYLNVVNGVYGVQVYGIFNRALYESDVGKVEINSSKYQ